MLGGISDPGPDSDPDPGPGAEAGARSIVIAGGSGFLGLALGRWFSSDGWQVTVLSRSRPELPSGCGWQHWDGETLAGWAASLDGAAAVVNLAGRSVNCRYTARNQAEIYASRLKPTAVLGEAIARCGTPPPVWINSSSATIYRHAEDRPMDEATGELGDGFSVDVCRRWEQALDEAATPRTRKVALRSALVLGRAGGVFPTLDRLVRLGLGGTLGPGTQRVSWVHQADFCRAVEWLIRQPELAGPVNCAAPEAPTNADFMRQLRGARMQLIGLPATRAMLEVGALVMRTETELLLKSRWVRSGRLLGSGFQFRFSTLASALADLCDARPAEPGTG